jgi:hypothetical protein
MYPALLAQADSLLAPMEFADPRLATSEDSKSLGKFRLCGPRSDLLRHHASRTCAPLLAFE